METPKNYKNKIHYAFINVMEGYDLSIRRIPFMEIESINDGPVVVLTACMHGDEIGGTVVIQELFKVLKRELKCGKIFAFPMLNPFGFENTSRKISISNEDLNRSFPGNPRGSLAQRIASIVVDKIVELNPNIILDLHNDWNKSIPYTLIDALDDQKWLSNLHSYAKILGLPAIQESEQITSSFSFNLNNKKIPALTLELGESLIINEKNVTYGINAIRNILKDFRMIDAGTNMEQINIHENIQNRILYYSSQPISSSSGIIRFFKKPGEIVYKGEKLAKIYNVFGKLNETIVSLNDGIVLGHNDYAVAYPGSPIMAFGVFHS